MKGVEHRVYRVSDEALVTMTLNGQSVAFEELVRRYERQLYSLTIRMMNNQEDANDVAQDIFIKIYHALPKFDENRKFFSWMYKIALNVCYDALKKRPPENQNLDNIIDFAPLIPEKETSPEEYFEAKENSSLVQQAISELPESFRVPILLRFMEEMSYQQISEVMELPVSTIETRLYRGKALLQKRLALLLERGVKSEVSRS